MHAVHCIRTRRFCAYLLLLSGPPAAANRHSWICAYLLLLVVHLGILTIHPSRSLTTPIPTVAHYPPLNDRSLLNRRITRITNREIF